MAGFIDTDCSDTSKSGPINLHTGWRRDGRREGAAAIRLSDKCLFDLFYKRHGGGTMHRIQAAAGGFNV